VILFATNNKNLTGTELVKLVAVDLVAVDLVAVDLVAVDLDLGLYSSSIAEVQLYKVVEIQRQCSSFIGDRIYG
jgi:hypothetical protein